MIVQLESLGADRAVYGTFQAYAAQGLVLARVATAQRDQYRIYTEHAELAAEPSGALWYRAATAAAMPVVGDWVAARVVDTEMAIVEAVLPRRTCFSRRAAGRREEGRRSPRISTSYSWSAGSLAISTCAVSSAT